MDRKNESIRQEDVPAGSSDDIAVLIGSGGNPSESFPDSSGDSDSAARALKASEKSVSRKRASLYVIAASALVLVASAAMFAFSGTFDERAVDVQPKEGSAVIEHGTEDGKSANASADAEKASQDSSDSREGDYSSADTADADQGPTASDVGSKGSTSSGGSTSSATSGQSVGSSDSGGSPSEGGSSSEGSDVPDPTEVTIYFGIDSSVVGGPVSYSGQLTLPRGATVLDALSACGVGYSSVGTPMGTYVSGIGGLSEKQHGDKSGWTYSVNGARPNKAAGALVLSDGDSVVWQYVV